MICSFLIQQTARETKLEHPIPQGVRGFCVLPDKTSQTGFDFERCDCGDPRRLAHQQRTLAKEKALEKLCRINPHPARPRLPAQQILGNL